MSQSAANFHVKDSIYKVAHGNDLGQLVELMQLLKHRKDCAKAAYGISDSDLKLVCENLECINQKIKDVLYL